MVSLSDARQQFIGHLKGKSRSSATILAYGKDIEQLVDHLKKEGVTDPLEVTTDQMKDFMAKLAKEGYTHKSISRKTNSTKTFFKFLKISGIIESDPATALEHPTFENKPPRILTKLEYRALRDAARGDIRMSAIIELLLQTGVRIGELSKITTPDINLEEENPTLYIRPTEGSVERTIPLNKPAVEILKKYLEIRPKTQNKTLFITKTGRPLLVRNIRTAIDRYFKLAGISGTKVNDLRHTWVTHQLASGISLTLVSKMAGHKRVSTTERYLQYIPQRTTEDKVKLEEL
ncbi:MAG: Tyrosine recombinase XerC [Candidatus Daviesbacteria bacterium GW2011_GWA1_41_61]|uniref:Tyrosine recombinase XerC n=1 Tax=Candidatus Daviesbacteria bacterium GW2011_GWA2_40_9 TaxID=1618424 RepID=A0A0G0X5B0_9BACT|nr:MAG: Tyrosine recombinase XerC [Candidatus Daviesbacteria bacterium GW2011_GWC1_40_9]KKR82822.1 MAG: Tyrosine recombinase XerC [Candidatus Daviesbacteria bacterium GW2011_GWA2_40_9]KKR93719.1 MAG: Tyrosine recombinase XerC [Candidatus Daviesbacteria bacterium GW2011_GWB1_41_15]KKS15185.1 MAG: Tyrosine recombinase XerC [Candidatus Daviesbacteria bacterium GW2011_GWA1_41_61]